MAYSQLCDSRPTHNYVTVGQVWFTLLVQFLGQLPNQNFNFMSSDG